jgi:hypothetical protein
MVMKCMSIQRGSGFHLIEAGDRIYWIGVGTEKEPLQPKDQYNEFWKI